MNKDDVIKQLDRVTEDYRYHLSERSTIKKWCITVWAAVLISIASGKLMLSGFGKVTLLSLPVLVFWFLESIHTAIAIRRQRFIRMLEKRLANEDFESGNSIEIYFSSSEESTPFFEKLSDLFTSVTKVETLNFLYILLIALSIVFVSFFGDGFVIK